MADLTFEQHANQARASCRRYGLADCIHYAPDWQRRADALCAVANAAYAEAPDQNARWWKDSTIGLLPDGRMALVALPSVECSVAEPIG